MSANESLSSYCENSLCSDDFTLVSDSDEETNLRGLNFYSLPNNAVNSVTNLSRLRPIVDVDAYHRTINYKYPCLTCGNPCRSNVQNSICCTLCDEWVHLNCTDLTLEQFNHYTSPDNLKDAYYCVNCMFGHSSNRLIDTPSNSCNNIADTANLLLDCGSDNVINLSPNSVFKNHEDLELTEYFTIESLNQIDPPLPNDILLVHINAVSLISKYDTIFDTLAELKHSPAIICISETKLDSCNLSQQIDSVRAPGYSFVCNNSLTKAGGTAMYISDSIKFLDRTDIKFDFPNCEACFVEILSDDQNHNQIIGTLYRHPNHNARLFTSYLREFLENFSARNT